MAQTEVLLLHGTAQEQLSVLADRSFRTCVTSPPYWGLRDYGHPDQIGLEPTPEAYVATMVAVFREVRRVLADDGTLWLNLGDSYATSGGAGTQGATGQRANRRFTAEGASAKGVPDGLKPKDLVGIPWRVAFALQADGWWLRSDIIWSKNNPMPESVTDRPTRAHEYVFLLSKSERYYYDAEAIKEPATGRASGNGFARPENISRGGPGTSAKWQGSKTRNARDVWPLSAQPFRGAHFATMPITLAEKCVLAGSARGDVVLDPFSGAGTTGLAAAMHGRHYVGIDVNAEYNAMARARIATKCGESVLFY